MKSKKGGRFLMMTWEKVNGNYFTPGGDPLWICPKCKSKKSRHCYGVEKINSPMHECPNCGEKLLYPWEVNR